MTSPVPVSRYDRRLRMIRTALLLVRDPPCASWRLPVDPDASLAAENLFLRRQLAFYLEGDLVFQRDSANSFFIRAFSVSSSFSRFASETLIPTNLLRHKQWLASEKLWRRLRSLTGRPASASRRKPTICASVNRFFVVRPLGGSDPGRYAGHAAPIPTRTDD